MRADLALCFTLNLLADDVRLGWPCWVVDLGAIEEDGMTSLPGQRILVVEDSWHLGVALKSLLRSVGADVVGPVATSAEAERLIAQQVPDVAIVDFNLRGGELAHDLIDKLNDLSVRVIVISGYATLPLAPEKVAAVLQKPMVEEQLLAALQITP
jgi:DNA-binding NtrC family response regulator